MPMKSWSPKPSLDCVRTIRLQSPTHHANLLINYCSIKWHTDSHMMTIKTIKYWKLLIPARHGLSHAVAARWLVGQCDIDVKPPMIWHDRLVNRGQPVDEWRHSGQLLTGAGELSDSARRWRVAFHDGSRADRRQNYEFVTNRSLLAVTEDRMAAHRSHVRPDLGPQFSPPNISRLRLICWTQWEKCVQMQHTQLQRWSLGVEHWLNI